MKNSHPQVFIVLRTHRTNEISQAAAWVQKTHRETANTHKIASFSTLSVSQCFQYNFQIFTPPRRSRGVVILKGVYLYIDIFVCAILQLQQRSVVRKLLRINF